MNFTTVLQAIKANPTSNSWRLSSKPGISQFSMVHHLHNLCKDTRGSRFVFYVTKILQNFQLTQIFYTKIIFCDFRNEFTVKMFPKIIFYRSRKA